MKLIKAFKALPTKYKLILGAGALGVGYLFFRPNAASAAVPGGTKGVDVNKAPPPGRASVPGRSPGYYTTKAYITFAQGALNAVDPPSPPLEVDGLIGSKTRAAIMSFQSKNALKVDGVLGDQTDAALRQALQAAGSSLTPPVG